MLAAYNMPRFCKLPQEQISVDKIDKMIEKFEQTFSKSRKYLEKALTNKLKTGIYVIDVSQEASKKIQK